MRDLDYDGAQAVVADSEHIWRRKLNGITAKVDAGYGQEWRLI